MNNQQTICNASLSCFHCQKKFKTAKTHATHIRKYHRIDIVPHLAEPPATVHHCRQCQKTYSTKAALRCHAFSHVSATAASAAAAAAVTPKVFRCDMPQCSKSFRNSKRLSEHKRRTHSGAVQLICEYCGYRTRFRCNLLVHRRTHTGELPFCCDRCGKCFGALQQLAEHTRTHVRLRSHRCDICGVAFLRPKALHHHGALHLAQKKFECRVCGKSYGQAAGLSQHMRWHRKMTTKKITFHLMPES